MTIKTATRYATPEQIAECWMMAKRDSKTHIDNDDALAYVTTHAELRNLMAAANAQMHLARYELEVSRLLDEDGCDHSPHFDRSFDHCMRAAKLRDEAKGMLQVAGDIDRETYEWLVYAYLHDLATI